ncbi:Hypothetical protein NTJ_09279 [Nesidiocoris tenuis]|uniref:Uncharacterized protein n=1 Tax=Nesidiocoris tenuis TaxID=355587 RepID=A0ABN7AWT4_9HEMI|nr:Hypothetical protein NTJ_09279 [Nesidiocoris tenuis]
MVTRRVGIAEGTSSAECAADWVRRLPSSQQPRVKAGGAIRVREGRPSNRQPERDRNWWMLDRVGGLLHKYGDTGFEAG